jgi:radical SAM-linked protein
VETPPGSSDTPPLRLEPRQRWRLTFSRVAADGEAAAGRDYTAAWERALWSSGLPVATNDAGRPRFSLGAPLPVRTAGLAELADLLLTMRIPGWRLRERLEPVLPPGHVLVDVEDIWLGAPPLTGRVAAADYAVRLAAGTEGRSVAAAAERVLAADRLIRERSKGGAVKSYDLRPLVVSILVDATAAAPAGSAGRTLRIRTRIHPELGSGRPEEVLAALAAELGEPIEALETVRERLLLLEDLDD